MVDCPDHRCPVCKGPMMERQKTGCSGRSRAEASRKRRSEALIATLDEAERALRKLRALIRREVGDEV